MKSEPDSAAKDWTRAFVAFGSNLVTNAFPDRAATVQHAIEAVAAKPDVRLVQRASFFETEPVPRADQPWYINTVCLYETRLGSTDFMQVCHQIEDIMGRQRSVPNAARVIDIDLIDFAGLVCGDPENKLAGLVLPHPSAHLRGFVLRPLAELQPNWHHPISDLSVHKLISDLPPEQDLGAGMRLFREEQT